MPTSIGFTGQRGDSVTGLDYYNARYYDPSVGQFLSADSVQGNAQGMDPYAYVGGNPETRTDPTGQFFYDDATGQAARILPNRKVVTWQYNSGYNSAPQDPVYQPSFLYTTRPVPTPTKSTHTNRSKAVPTAAAVLSPGLLKLAVNLIRNNERLKADFGSAQWKLLGAKRGIDIVNDPGDYPDRWYFTFDDGGGSKVVMSLNLNPKAGPANDPWDMRRIHFSSNEFQLDPGKWGKNGTARNDWGLDPGSSENPGKEEDMSFIAKMMAGVPEEEIAIDEGE